MQFFSDESENRAQITCVGVVFILLTTQCWEKRAQYLNNQLNLFGEVEERDRPCLRKPVRALEM